MSNASSPCYAPPTWHVADTACPTATAHTHTHTQPDSVRDIVTANACKADGNRYFTHTHRHSSPSAHPHLACSPCRLFAEGKYEDALAAYRQALRYAPDDMTVARQRAIFYSNRAACFIKLVRPPSAHTNTTHTECVLTHSVRLTLSALLSMHE